MLDNLTTFAIYADQIFKNGVFIENVSNDVFIENVDSEIMHFCIISYC